MPRGLPRTRRRALYGFRSGYQPTRSGTTKRQVYSLPRSSAQLLSHYFDLTHKIETVHRAKQTIAQNPSSEKSIKDPLDTVNRLVSPRVHILFDGEPESTPEEPRRSVCFHGVTWHTRELPEGWHASPEAIARAKAAGIILAPNETFVKDHHRGSKKLGEVVSHRFIRLD